MTSLQTFSPVLTASNCTRSVSTSTQALFVNLRFLFVSFAVGVGLAVQSPLAPVDHWSSGNIGLIEIHQFDFLGYVRELVLEFSHVLWRKSGNPVQNLLVLSLKAVMGVSELLLSFLVVFIESRKVCQILR
jgi:hypothetical protein